MEGASRRGREGDEVIGTGWESQRRMLKCLELDPRILSSIRDWQWQMLIEPTLSNVLGTWFVQGREWWTWLTRNLCATLRCTDTVLCTSVPLAQYTGTVHIAIIFTRTGVLCTLDHTTQGSCQGRRQLIACFKDEWRNLKDLSDSQYDSN